MNGYGLCIFSGICFSLVIAKIFRPDKEIDFFTLTFYLYSFSFFCGKLFFILFDYGLFSLSIISPLDLIFYGFSLLGASLGGIIGFLLYCQQIPYKATSALNLIPVLILLINSFGRLGCFYAGCCQGSFFGLPLEIITSLFYLLSFISGFFLCETRNLSVRKTLFYYAWIIFCERFLFDIYRLDATYTAYFLTTYQVIAIAYLITALCLIYFFSPKSNPHLQ